MFRHADNGSRGGTHADAMDSGGLNDDLNLMIEAEVNEGGPTLPDPSEVSAGKASSVQGAHAVSPELSSSGPCPAPDEVVLLPLGPNLYGSKSKTLIKTSGFELIRLVVPAGKEIAKHRAPTEVTVQCIEGRVSFTYDGSTKELRAGELLHMCPGKLHSVKGLENSSLLLTLRLPLSGQAMEVV